MAETLSPSARRIQDALAAFGLACQVVELPAGTPNADFRLTPIDLRCITGGRVVAVK